MCCNVLLSSMNVAADAIIYNISHTQLASYPTSYIRLLFKKNKNTQHVLEELFSDMLSSHVKDYFCLHFHDVTVLTADECLYITTCS